MEKKQEYQVTKSMHRPPHPGNVLKDAVLEPLGLTVTQAAERLGVDRKTLSRVLNGRASVSVDMSLRLAQALGTSPELWLGMQQAYDLWEARHGGVLDFSHIRRWDDLSGAARP